MKVLADTSALYAFLDSADKNHSAAHETMERLREEEAQICSHEYIFVETVALVQNRLGAEALEAFYRKLWPLVEEEQVDLDIRARAMEYCLGRRSKTISFVDSVSFLIMKDRLIDKAFTFDSDFKKEGLTIYRG